MTGGKVLLIGAGPGDPGLLTLRGAECLSRADVVVYDRLVNPELLGLARGDAEMVDVGKLPGAHRVPQEEINRLLLERAREGKTVARLKGGDPFVFGRGGEEAEFLAESGVPFEVVPGVTSAVAVPAYAGIPVTHRDHCSSLHLITAHQRAGKRDGDPDYGLLARLEGTLVFLMGARALGEIAAGLVRNGKSPDTPAAVIERGTLPSQRTVVGTLADIAAKAEEAGVSSPAITIVGSVVSLGSRLAWRRPGPLAGKTVMVLRAREQAESLVRLLRDNGAGVIEFPVIRLAEPADYTEVDRCLGRLRSYSHIVFTSPNGVTRFWRRLRDLSLDVRNLAGLRVCAIGPGTAGALAERGIRADIVPEIYETAALMERLLAEPAGSGFLLARSDLAAPGLAEGLRAAGHRVDDVAFYRVVAAAPTVDPATLVGGRSVDYVTFTSPSTVRGFVGLIGRKGLDLMLARPATFVYIGGVTARAARESKLPGGLTADPHTVDGLVRAILEHAAGGAGSQSVDREVPGGERQSHGASRKTQKA